MFLPASFRLRKLFETFEAQASIHGGDAEPGRLALRRIDRIVAQLRASTPKDIPLPNKGQRFKVAQEVDVTALVYLQHECREDLFIPLAMIPHTLRVGELLVLPYQPDHTLSVGCELIPAQYCQLEREIVPLDLLNDKQYVGYTFGVYYEVLYSHFLWL